MSTKKFNFKYIKIEDSSEDYMLDTAPLKVLSEIKTHVLNIQSNTLNYPEINSQLAGQIDKEYTLPDLPNLKSYIKILAEEYNKKSKYIPSLNFKYNIPFKLTFGDIWVNFQEKYEYNPIHHHTGILSFVLWYKIPYYFKDEGDLGPGKKKLINPEQNQNNGGFQFIARGHRDPIQVISLPIDKEYEGVVSIFPSHLSHIVYPFYSSDEQRITIAGNLNVGT